MSVVEENGEGERVASEQEGVPSLPCLEAPDMAPWTDSVAWLTVFLRGEMVSQSCLGDQVRGRRGKWGANKLT